MMAIRTAILIILCVVLIYVSFMLINRYVSNEKEVIPEPIVLPELEPEIEPTDWNFSYMDETKVEVPVEVILPPIRRLIRRFGHMHRRMRRPEHRDQQLDDLLNTIQLTIDQPDIIRIQVIPEPNIERPPSPQPRQQPEQFFGNLVQHQNDSQNVHDSNIRKDLTKKLLRIIELHVDHVTPAELGVSEDQYTMDKMAQTTHEIKRRAAEYFNGVILREEDPEKSASIRVETDLKLKKIDIVLEKVKNGFTLVMSNGIIYREDYILNQVWDRINCEDNRPNREQLQIALIDNLVDCVYKTDSQFDVAFAHIVRLITGEQYTAHCINGRCARMITSLVLLDNDEIIATPEKDMAEIANEAYSKAHVTLNAELAKFTPEQEELFGEDIENLTPEQQNEVKELEDRIKKEIARVLTADYKDLIDEIKLEEIIQKAQAGV